LHLQVSQVNLFSIDTSARPGRNSVLPNEDAFYLKWDLISSFFPHYDFLGDFHTHPFEDFREVEDGYCLSDQDRYHIQGEPGLWCFPNYRISLVLTIALMKRRSSRLAEHVDSSTIRFDLGNYRFWLKGYVAYESEEQWIQISEDEDENIHLDCPALSGLKFEHRLFGIGKQKRGEIRHELLP